MAKALVSLGVSFVSVSLFVSVEETILFTAVSGSPLAMDTCHSACLLFLSPTLWPHLSSHAFLGGGQLAPLVGDKYI